MIAREPKSIKKLIKRLIRQYPLLYLLFRAVDPFDWIVRLMHRRGYLPKYSIRVLSSGITKQFGGRSFVYQGQLFANYLVEYASLNWGSRVLEIGCGCGRTAYALTNFIAEANYVGMDIEKRALLSCRRDPLFAKKKFQFDFLNVQNPIYNPAGKSNASNYKFPYPDASFDIVFLVSVFTYMMLEDVRNYIAEIGRVLVPNGIFMMSAFLIDCDRIGQIREANLPLHLRGGSCDLDQSLADDETGYCLSFLREEFGRHGMYLAREPLLGGWRKHSVLVPPPKTGEDFLFFRRKKV